MNPYLNRYRTTQVATADGPKVLMMIFDQTLAQLELARKALREGGRLELPLLNAMNSVMALVTALDPSFNQELAENLQRLYLFILELLREGLAERQDKPLGDAFDLLSQLQATWSEAVDQERRSEAPSTALGAKAC